ncbi:hypothetical protein MY010_34460 [Escherichia coli]|uniref:Uncharacterized protein n=1 Tax=Escherichia coli TaxID=562 RepID=A0A8S0FRI0_ECOLX|nr:conserved hypothetical protein [Escherichia coli]BBU50075.1 hypothetical protein ECO25NV_17300 [Escherichia coli O25:H4]CUW81962.1 conserved hypothetical protein [Escherichia coli]CUX87604.1 conserved hypothetical protein [Escherichia coli]BBU82843.1 hypothetical protein EIMP300_42430 [Escherichia coli]
MLYIESTTLNVKACSILNSILNKQLKHNNMNNATIIRKLSLQIFLALKKTKSNVIEIIVEMLKLSTPNV